VALAILLVAVLVTPASLAAFGIGALAAKYEEAVTIWFTVHLSGLVIVGVAWYLGVHRCRAPVSMLGLVPWGVPRPKTIVMTVGTLGFSLTATAVYATLMNAAGPEVFSPPDIPSDIAFPGLGIVFTFQALALATPLTEEIFFRGFIFSGLISRLGVGWAMVASAAIFSVSHLSLGVLVPIFITGLALAWLYWRTGSLWTSIAAHAGQNALVVAIQAYLA
jgi:membrane protease YdiL (CAAX protease family)